MNFIEKLLGLMKEGFTKIIEGFNALIRFLVEPLSLLFALIDGIFYFFMQLFQIVVKLIMIVVAMFQFVGSMVAGIFRTLGNFLFTMPSTSNLSFPSESYQGFQVVMDLLQPTGLLTIVPIVAGAFVWFFFALKIVTLFGGSIHVAPFGRGGKD